MSKRQRLERLESVLFKNKLPCKPWILVDVIDGKRFASIATQSRVEITDEEYCQLERQYNLVEVIHSPDADE